VAVIHSEAAGGATGDAVAGAFKLLSGCIFQIYKTALESVWLVVVLTHWSSELHQTVPKGVGRCKILLHRKRENQFEKHLWKAPCASVPRETHPRTTHRKMSELEGRSLGLRTRQAVMTSMSCTRGQEEAIAEGAKHLNEN
jgi:hypothetical protein